MAQRPQDRMEIDAIDSLLGEPTPRVKPRIETPMPRVEEMPRVPVGGPALSRETSGLTDEPTLVGARGGATTMLEPTSAPVTPPPAAPDMGVSSPTTTTSGSSGAGGGNLQDAFQSFRGSINPNAPRGDMEAAIERAFSSVPGYRGAYKESVNINGTWYDLVNGYGGANASFQMLPKTGGGSGVGMDFMQLDSAGGGNIGAGALGGESRLDAILASIDAMARGVDSPLQKQAIDQELAAPAALTDPTAMLHASGAVAPPRARREGLAGAA